MLLRRLRRRLGNTMLQVIRLHHNLDQMFQILLMHHYHLYLLHLQSLQLYQHLAYQLRRRLQLK